jgi:hypothetical protein
MTRYWIVGGEYTDTSFRTLAPGQHEERIGPFDNYDAAYTAWFARARATIDNATIRYRIVPEAIENAA